MKVKIEPQNVKEGDTIKVSYWQGKRFKTATGKVRAIRKGAVHWNSYEFALEGQSQFINAYEIYEAKQ